MMSEWDSDDSHRRQRTCFGFDEDICRTTWIAIALVFILITLGIIAFFVAEVNARDSRHRSCGIASASELSMALGETTTRASARYTYRVVFDNDRNAIWFRLRWNTSSTPSPSALYLRGPQQANSDVALVRAVLCGEPHGLACDAGSVPGQLESEVQYTVTTLTSSSGVDVRTVTNPFRMEPESYYLEVLTGAPSAPAARSQLTAQCGYR